MLWLTMPAELLFEQHDDCNGPDSQCKTVSTVVALLLSHRLCCMCGNIRGLFGHHPALPDHSVSNQGIVDDKSPPQRSISSHVRIVQSMPNCVANKLFKFAAALV